MAADWKRLRIDEVADRVAMGPFGSSIKVSTFVDEGIPVISGQHLRGWRLEDNKFNFVTEDHADALKNANVFRGDVIFTHAGNIGQCAYIPNTSRYPRYVLSQRQFYMRCDRSKISPEFVALFFKSAEGRHALLANASQVGVPSIARPVTFLRTIEIPVPPLPEQKAIAAMLGMLDDKIELNRRMNATLEAMARALFQSWFVDFDPIRAKLDGRLTGVDPETAALFPNEFQDSELGPIPKGWKVGSILCQANLLSGGTPKTDRPEFWGGDIAWASAKDVSQCGESFLIMTDKKITQQGLEKSATKMIPQFATVVVARGATTGRLTMFGERMAMNQTCYGLYSNLGAPFALYCHARDFIDRMVHAAHGSVFDTITTRTFEATNVLLPSTDVLLAFDERVAPLFQLVRSNLYQSRTLAEIRDTLLPRLLSGAIPILSA